MFVKGSGECAISSVGMACVFLVLKSEFKPCFGSHFFQDQFFFLNIFMFFYLPIVFLNHSRVKIKI